MEAKDVRLSFRSAAVIAVLAVLSVALAALLAPATGQAWTGYAGQLAEAGAPNALIPFDTGTGQLGTPITLAKIPRGLAISPDGRTAWVTLRNPDRVAAVNLATGTVEREVEIPTPEVKPYQVGPVAISPDGSTVWVALLTRGSLYPVDTATGTRGDPIEVGAGIWDIAIAPDGESIWVSTNYDPGKAGSTNGLARVNIADGSVTQVIGDVPSNDVVVSPDGGTVYLASWGSLELNVYDVAGDSITAWRWGDLFRPRFLALAPDGNRIYMSSGDSKNLLVAANALDGTLPVESGTGTEPWAVAVTPDSASVWLGLREGRGLQPYDPTTGTIGAAVSTPGMIEPIAIVPQQPPTAALTASPAATMPGKRIDFDASGTEATDRPVADSYVWDFGDGATETTTGPNASHTYSEVGDFTASVTVEDVTGCGITPVFTGKTASCGGGPAARASQEIKIMGPNFCDDRPDDPECQEPVARKPKLGTIRVTPKLRRVKRGKAAVFTIRVRNRSGKALPKTRVCVKAPKRLVKAKWCTRRWKLARGASAPLRFRLRVKAKARRGKKIKLVFRAEAPAAKPVKATARIKVR